MVPVGCSGGSWEQWDLVAEPREGRHEVVMPAMHLEHSLAHSLPDSISQQPSPNQVMKTEHCHHAAVLW